MKSSLQVIERFYRRPQNVRQKALTLGFSEPENLVGWRTKAYQPAGIRKLIETRFGIAIEYWERDLEAAEACNGVFFTAFSRGGHAEAPGIHFDDPPHWMMVLIYLTPSAPADTGTSFWQHRQTGLIRKPTSSDAKRLGIPLKELKDKLSDEGHKRGRWIEIDRVGNVFNRAVMFPSGLFHSATRHFGNSLTHGRLYQTFHFPIRR